VEAVVRLVPGRFFALALVGLIAVAVVMQPAGPLLAAGTLDQSQTSQPLSLGPVPPGVFLGQTFTAGLTGLLDQVSVAVMGSQQE
jgi:hypothetical protein